MFSKVKIGKKRRKELLEYDDRQRMLRLVDEFSDEQVNRKVKNNHGFDVKIEFSYYP